MFNQLLHYKSFRRRMYLIASSSLFFLSVSVSFGQREISSNTSSYMQSKYATGGSFAGYHPSQELIEKRTKNAKHFDNGNGSFTVVTGNTYHYQDVDGKWKDIDLGLKAASGSTYSFINETNEFKSYFPSLSGQTGVKMKLGSIDFTWWKQPTLNYVLNGQTIQTVAAQSSSASIGTNDQTVEYNNVYQGITEQFVMNTHGIKSNTIIHSLNSEISQLSSETDLMFSQFIPLQPDWSVEVDGKPMTGKFNAEHFHIQIPGTKDGIYFGSILVFDNKLSNQEAEALYLTPSDKMSAVDKQLKANNTLLCKYEIELVDGGMIVSMILPNSWLKSAERSFPVTIDPTVTITPTPVYSGGYFYAPTSNWYGYQRHANLYLASEIGVSNITISAIEYNRISTSGNESTAPYKVYFKTTPSTSLSAANWNSTSYTGGLTPSFDASINLHGTTTGWKMINLTNSFVYAGDNLLVMVSDFYGNTGSAKYLGLTTNSSPAGRQASKRQDNSDPGDGTSLNIENYLPEIRLTYTFNNACAGTPTAGIANSSVTNACAGVPFNITLNGATMEGGITYQWQSSPAGQNNFSDIAGETNIIIPPIFRTAD